MIGVGIASFIVAFPLASLAAWLVGGGRISDGNVVVSSKIQLWIVGIIGFIIAVVIGVSVTVASALYINHTITETPINLSASAASSELARFSGYLPDHCVIPASTVVLCKTYGGAIGEHADGLRIQIPKNEVAGFIGPLASSPVEQGTEDLLGRESGRWDPGGRSLRILYRVSTTGDRTTVAVDEGSMSNNMVDLYLVHSVY